jgi:hypothetical protein
MCPWHNAGLPWQQGLWWISHTEGEVAWIRLFENYLQVSSDELFIIYITRRAPTVNSFIGRGGRKANKKILLNAPTRNKSKRIESINQSMADGHAC